ncbi:hypothetical protein CDD83_575 [Cordyceps sp. RAO-2017]|nr:hypothetical protein CDD83_575 [Cordyceps sp. RAO-2017]
MTPSPYVGQRISYGGAVCTVRYVGPVAGTTGSWLGIEWDDATRGKHDGSHKGVRYFSCLSRSPTAASFVRPTRPADKRLSFIAALREKYASEAPQLADGAPIVISGKVAEEMGFDKVRRKLARLDELRVVLLDGMRVASAVDEADGARVAETCPSIAQLDLSRNLLERLGPVLDICAELPALRHLSLNGNRFQHVADDTSLADDAAKAFGGVDELALGETLLGWEELCRIASLCPSLRTLAAGANQLSCLPAADYGGLATTLTSINLEYNDFKAVSDLAGLTSLRALRNLHLKGNAIAAMAAPGAAAPTFPPALQYLDVSYNDIRDWAFVDALAAHFPGLTGLRIAHNPVYDGRDAGAEAAVVSWEESYMITIGRLACLRSVNFTQVTAEDRKNAETFYLSRIAKQLAAVPESAEHGVLASHPRYRELCRIHGAPDVIRRSEVNPAFLEARLVAVRFRREGGPDRAARIPRALDIYSVRAIAGRLFGLSPLRLRLVWETDEWDPVAGYDERDADDDAPHRADGSPGQPGRWLKREVELTHGPKQLGYCVDGMDVRIRVEPS